MNYYRNLLLHSKSNLVMLFERDGKEVHNNHHFLPREALYHHLHMMVVRLFRQERNEEFLQIQIIPTEIIIS